MKTILSFEWLLFRRNKFQVGMLLFLFLAGIYALYYGRSFNQRQLQTIHALDTAYQNRVQKQLKDFSADTSTKEGKESYAIAHDPFMNEYHVHPLVWKQPLALQALSIGQSDNQPFYNNLWLYDDFIYSNKEVEIRNPDKLLAGNFDLAFLFIYLLPLIAIAFSYAVYSSDKEAGITALLSAHGISLKKMIAGRLAFRFFIMAALVMVLNTAGFLWNGINQADAVAYWSATSLLYLLFWFALIYAVVSLKRNTSVTALILVSAWVFFLILIPSWINSLSLQKDAEGLELSNADREYSIHLWDLWQSKTTALQDTLFREKPDWKKYPVRDTNELHSVGYSYFNMLYMNRMGSRKDSSEEQEQDRLHQFNWINPAYVTQQTFNLLAATESVSFVQYRKAAAAYQKDRSEMVHELRLSGKPFTVEVFKRFPVFRQPDYTLTMNTWLLQLLPLLVLMLFFLQWGRLLNRKQV